MGGSCNTYWRQKVVYRVLVRRPAGKIPLGRPSRRWEDNIEMDVEKFGWRWMD
jgi:hypothetical protein